MLVLVVVIVVLVVIVVVHEHEHEHDHENEDEDVVCRGTLTLSLLVHRGAEREPVYDLRFLFE